MFKRRTLGFMAIAMMVLMLALTLGACEEDPEQEPEPEKVAAPVANPPGGTYSGNQSVTLTSATEGVAIYYTTNGNTLTTSSVLYTSPIVVSENTTIMAIAVRSGMTNSDVLTAAYTITNPELGPLTEVKWLEILQDIEADSAFNGTLDLSAYTRSDSATDNGLRSDGTFDPDSSILVGKSKIVSLILPSTTTGIAGGTISSPTFSHFTNLETFSGTMLSTIGDYAFAESTSLAITTLPAFLTSIGIGAFQGCTGITEITLPAELSFIGDGAFQDCTNLALVTSLRTTPPTLGVNAFSYTHPNMEIRVPEGSVEAYNSAWWFYMGIIDFNNYSSNAAIRVRNLTNQSLVLFKNELTLDAILGGLEPYAGGDGWGIRKDTKHFSTTGEFSMIVLTLDQFLNNMNNLASQTNTPFTRVYVFYNAAGENETLYEISDKLGGQYRLRIENPTNLNVELRAGGINGPTLGYAPAGMLATTLYVQAGDLDFFPVFKRFNPQRNIVETIYPKGHFGRPWMEVFPFGEGPDPMVYNIGQALSYTSGRSSGVAYLKIVNFSDVAVRLYRGSEIVFNTFGISYMPSNSAGVEYEVLMPGTNFNFDESITLSNYRIGPTAGSVPITAKDTGATSFELFVDKSYTVTFTGNYMQGNLKAEIDLENAQDISFDFFTFY